MLIGCSDPPPEKAVDVEQTAHQGEEIYMLYCASCHGPSGDGKGFIELDRPARSFITGGFSFGNTIHAISKTTYSGIPGTPMPPFAEVLDSTQIKLVAEHVRSFAPSLQEVSPDETEYLVADRPLVIRGMIPSLHEGEAVLPRGLVVGNPDRFSYEYSADDVRLLAVRQGQFVRRADWGERGGSPLELLGSVVVQVTYDDTTPLFTLEDGTPLKAALKATNTLGPYATVQYALQTPEHETIATVQERCIPTTGTRTLIQQQCTIETSQPLLIHPPHKTDISIAPLIPTGTHDFTITHALYGGDS